MRLSTSSGNFPKVHWEGAKPPCDIRLFFTKVASKEDVDRGKATHLAGFDHTLQDLLQYSALTFSSPKLVSRFSANVS